MFAQNPSGHTTSPAGHLASHSSTTHTSSTAHSVPVGHFVWHCPSLHALLPEQVVVQSPQ
jgi:hypothetical protein